MMSKSLVRLMVLVGIVCGQSGCALVGPARQFTTESWRIFKPNPRGYRDGTDEVDDQWSIVGIEGRGDRPLEREPDPFKKWLQSPKARSIERNLRIE